MSVNLVKALYTFYKQLVTRTCAHERVNPKGEGSYCPDCGYPVKIVWAMLRCRTCGTKRHPQQAIDGSIEPLYKYCQHCGGLEHQLLKRARIHAHEMPYAICLKEVDYMEHKPPSTAASAHVYNRYADANPFEVLKNASHIVDGEVLKTRVITHPGR